MEGTTAVNKVDAVGGYRLVDRHGRLVGQVNHVVAGDADGPDTPVPWLVVHTGLFRGHRLVPARGVYRTADRNLVVPFTQAQIRSTPRARPTHTPGPGLLARLNGHYRLPG